MSVCDKITHVMAFKAGKKESAVNWVPLDIKSGDLKNLYILYGDDPYVRDTYFNMLEKALMPDNAEMNYSRYDGISLSSDELFKKITASADTMPFFADKRLITVKGSGWFKNGNEQFAKYLATLPSTTFIIFSENEIDKRKSICKAAEEKGRLIAYNKLEDKDLQNAVVAIILKNGKAIRQKTYDLFIEKTGSDMATVTNELEKLICYTGDRKEITEDDVNALVSTRLEDNVFLLVNAMTDKDQHAALDSYYDLIRNKASVFGILSLLYKQFNAILMVKELLSAGFKTNDIADKLGCKPYAAEQRARAAARFSKYDLQEFLKDYAEVQQQIKSGSMDQKLAVERLIIKHTSRIHCDI